jgi:2-C-methyl-D-erythritol 2,4-cyclodiphosphate synthase
MFPSSDDRWANASSIEMLRLAALRVSSAGYKLVNLDATIIAETPKLAPHITKMRETIAGALGAAIEQLTQINVKATTTDGLGFTGRAEGIAAFAVALLE